MWANSVWGLFGLSASCVLTMLGLAPESSWQPLLLLGAVAFFIGSVVVLCWPLHLPANRANVVALASHPAKALRLIEPSHIIILGLLIALGGVIWQMRRAPQAAPQQIASTQNDHLAAMVAASSPPTTKVPEISTASIDIPKKIEAIDELTDILDKEWDPWLNLCQGLSTGGWRNQILGKKIKELRDSIYKMSNDYYVMSRKIQALNKRNEKFPDIHALTTQPYAEQLRPKLDSFVKVFGGLSDQMGMALDQPTLENVFEKYATDLYAQSQAANNWRILTARNALEIRKSLSR